MMIIPALDLIDGNIVRLFQGDYGKVNQYLGTPEDKFTAYAQAGSQQLHLVDLTGAKDPKKRQLTLIQKILSAIDVPLQVGGGIREKSDVEALLNAGANRVVIGSTAITKPEEVKAWFKLFGPEKIVLALDVRIDPNNVGKVAISGWQESSECTIDEVIEDYQHVGLINVLCTDISKDGTLSGSNVALYQRLSQAYPTLQIQASGGIGSLEDIKALEGSGVSGVIVGRALLEEKFTIEEALKCWQNESSLV